MISQAVRWEIMATCGALALIWAAYVVKRHPQLSPAHVCDQCGMAASLLAVLMFASTAWRAFGY
jgi:hypothetical protein